MYDATSPMIGRFIIECDPEHFDVAKDAIVFLQENPTDQYILTIYGDNDMQVHMSATRLKKSIRVKQVRP